MKLLYGKPVAEKILGRLKTDIFRHASKPGLAVILVGDDQASHLYVTLKEKMAKEIGMNFFRRDLSENISEDELLLMISQFNVDPNVHGIIVQLPLPKKFDTDRIISAIMPQKDADGFHSENIEHFLAGTGNVWPVFPRAIMQLIENSGEKLTGKNGVVVANSHEFGKIMCACLDKLEISSEYVLSKDVSWNLGKIKAADVLVSAVGSPGLIRGEMLKEGAIIIDGGIEKVDDKVLGDVDFGSTKELSGHITPVPGGVGPVTIACLLENVYLAFEAQQKEKKS
ncbi:MAG: bifunctional 5,10-methylenetetrahydrofolate dehydrogenase/5,10-methenyltetrahydrofolate cyclohydrolase [Candidatus Moranbacteria bacterium]|nr:bifunctional 5,10-methylenetetrahydrofolate dehydrogenase/5,10-methenyltetrahydrofolate cyclohydrolase [Candidatus Moranbacteria bacterium]